MTENDMMIMPTEQVKALMTALLASDRIQEPLENILSDDAEAYRRMDNFLGLMGLGDKSKLRSAALDVKRAGALQRAVANEDLYLRMRMIKHDVTDAAYYEVGEDAPETQEGGEPDGGTGSEGGDGHIVT